jgi:retron-type reverse transcriptase
MEKRSNNKTKQTLKRSQIVSSEIEQAKGNKFLSQTAKSKIKVLENIRNSVSQAINNHTSIPIFNSLIPIISSKELLLLAYGNIKSNRGATTPGSLRETADESSMRIIQTLSQQLKSHTYKFPDVRRTWVPKPIKGIDWKKKENLMNYGRPLGMPDFSAKLIQEAIRLVLNAIYEPIFENIGLSYGFRPKMGCHSPMITLPNRTQGMTIALEGDIKGAFNELNHEEFISILSRRITDKKFLNLILDMCKAGIMDQMQNIRTDSLLGVPQSSIVSPLFWNIYMHEFDKYINNDITALIETINKRQGRYKKSQDYTYRKFATQSRIKLKRAEDLYKYSNTTNNMNSATKARKLSRIFNLIGKYNKQRSLAIPTVAQHKQEIRYAYFRYADDWILFTSGNKTLVKYIKNKLAAFLKYRLKLTLSLKKTKITNLYADNAKFLGFAIKAQRFKKISKTKFGTLKRVTGNKLYIGVDKERLLQRLEWRGYIKKGKPREQPAWSTLTDFEIINKYNSVMRGLVNYYAPIIAYRSTLNYYIYILEYSCYKTLAQKYRTSIRKLLRKHKQPLTLKHEGKSITLITGKTYWPLLQPTVEKMVKNLRMETPNQELLASSDFLNNSKTYWRTQFKFLGRCVICSSKDHVEMHHINHVRNTNERVGFAKIMSLLNRKQIPVCKFHHKAIHDGKYDTISLSELYDTRIAQVENYLTLHG